MIKNRPQIWGSIYDNPKFINKTKRIKEFIHKSNSEKIGKLIKEFTPDAIVCTQAYPCGLVADYKKSNNINKPLIAVLTDFAGHAYWLYDAVDYFVVACREAKERFIRGSIPEKKERRLIFLMAFPFKADFVA